MLEIAIVSDEISLNIQEAVTIGTEMGIKKYELRCVGSYEKRIPYLDQADLEYIDRAVESGRIRIGALSPGTFKVKPSDTIGIRKAMEDVLPKTFALAHRWGTNKIITFGFLQESLPEEEIVGFFQRIADMAAGENLTIAVENEPGFYCDSGENTARIVRKVNRRNFGANWDAANAVGTGEMPYPTGYEFIKPHIMNVHVKDAVSHPQITCKLFGEGAVNWVGQLAALQRDKIIEYVTLETHYLPLVESTKISFNRLRALLKLVESDWDL